MLLQMLDVPVLLVAIEPAVQQSALDFLQARGHRCVLTGSLKEAVQLLARSSFSFTLLDLSTNSQEGEDLDLLSRLRLQEGDPGALIGLVAETGMQDKEGLLSLLVDALLHKPFADADLAIAINTALARLGATRAVAEEPPVRIRREMDLWRSPRMHEVVGIIREAAAVDITVLVTGETGTGKDLVARAIHSLSARRGAPFVKVNCAAVPRDLLESELFGYERGAFTGANKLKVGKFESAHRGTIFLDEIGDLHPDLQGKLLHVLQDGEFSRVGGKSALKVDVRVIAATNQNLEQAAADGRFREDLFYRLNVIQVAVPPLRQRPEEIPLLIDYFVARYSRLFRRHGFSIPPAVVNRLVHYRFPGNVRELENLVKRMIVLGDPFLARTPLDVGDPSRISPDPALDAAAPSSEVAQSSLREIGRKAALAAQREAIARVLQQAGWNRTRAAKTLRVSYRALLYKMKETGLGNRGRSNAGRPDRQGGHTV
jgi:two-component system response regulator AtoC